MEKNETINKTLTLCAEEAYDLEHKLMVLTKKYQEVNDEIEELERYKNDWYLKAQHIKNLEGIIDHYKYELESVQQRLEHLNHILNRFWIIRIMRKIKHRKER